MEGGAMEGLGVQLDSRPTVHQGNMEAQKRGSLE